MMRLPVRALAVAIDRALHMRGALLHSGDGVGHGQANIVVRVDAHHEAPCGPPL